MEERFDFLVKISAYAKIDEKINRWEIFSFRIINNFQVRDLNTSHLLARYDFLFSISIISTNQVINKIKSLERELIKKEKKIISFLFVSLD